MFLNGEPERLRCVFDSDELARDVLYGERQIIVYPVKAFRNLYSKSEQLNEFDRRVNMLTKALNTRHYDHGEISLLPSIDAYQVIRAHVKFLNFHGGRGIRFISRYATDVSPTTGRNIFYTYQGLTNDGRYWVSVFYPLQASFKGTTNEALATRRLNALTDQQFKPALSNLDHMVMSIKITLPRESSVQH